MIKPDSPKYITEGFFTEEMKKYVTISRFDAAMMSIAQSFQAMHERFDRLENSIAEVIRVS